MSTRSLPLGLLGSLTLALLIGACGESRKNGHLGQVEERGQWTEQVISAV
jgi:hypothetical protein